MVTGISFLGQTQAQTGRLKQLNVMMSDLQRQLTTQKKTETFAGLGSDALNVQKYRMDKNLMKTYSGNIDSVSNRIELMSTGLERASTSAREVLASLKTKIGNMEDLSTIRSISTQSLPLIRDIANLEIDGRYLFAGSSTGTEPLASNNNMNMLAQSAWTDWKAGTITTAQLQTRLDSMTSTDMGFDPALTSAGNVNVQIDKSTTLDYTSVASNNGLQDVYQAIAMLSNFPGLDSATDVPDSAELEKVLTGIVNKLQKGIDAMEVSAGELGTKYDLMNTVQEDHASDMSMLDTMVADKENVDTAEVSLKILSLQNQLSASYQVTSIISQLSLVNFI